MDTPLRILQLLIDLAIFFALLTYLSRRTGNVRRLFNMVAVGVMWACLVLLANIILGNPMTKVIGLYPGLLVGLALLPLAYFIKNATQKRIFGKAG